jgi:hypothetical protein
LYNLFNKIVASDSFAADELGVRFKMKNKVFDPDLALAIGINEYEQLHPKISWPEWFERCRNIGVKITKHKNSASYYISYYILRRITFSNKNIQFCSIIHSYMRYSN